MGDKLRLGIVDAHALLSELNRMLRVEVLIVCAKEFMLVKCSI